MMKWRLAPLLLFLLTVAIQSAFAQDGPIRPPVTRENAANVVHLGAAGSERIADIAWSPDGTTLAVSTGNGVALYDPGDLNQPPQYLRDPEQNARRDRLAEDTTLAGGKLVYLEDGDVLLAGHEPWLNFWDMRTHTTQGVYISGELGPNQFAYDADRAWLVIGGNIFNPFLSRIVTNVNGLAPPGEPLDFYENRDKLPHYPLRSLYVVSDLDFSPDTNFVALSSALVDPDYTQLMRYQLPRSTTSDVLVWDVERVLFWEKAHKYLLNYGNNWYGSPPYKRLRGHTAPIRQITYNADGSLLASAGLDGTVRLWTMPEGTSRAVLHGHLAAVWDVDFSPDGASLASGGSDGRLCLWDVESGALLWNTKLAVAIQVVAFSPDGKRIAAAGQDGSLWLFDANTGALLDSRLSLPPPWSVDFSPDGLLLATGDVNNQVILWDVLPEIPTAYQRQALQGHAGPVYDVAFSPDGTLLASASSDHTVRLWKVQTGAEIAVFEGHTASVYGVAFSPDGRLLASASWDRTVRSWDVASGKQLRVLDSEYPVYSVAFSPSGRLLAYGDTYLWDRDTNHLLAHWDTHHGWNDSYASSISKVIFSSDGQLLINGTYIYAGGVWNVDTLEDIHLCDGAPAMAVHGDLLAVENLGLCDLTDGQWFIEPHPVDPRLTTRLTRDIAFSPDGTLIVTAGTDRKLHFWGVSDLPAPATEAE